MKFKENDCSETTRKNIRTQQHSSVITKYLYLHEEGLEVDKAKHSTHTAAILLVVALIFNAIIIAYFLNAGIFEQDEKKNEAQEYYFRILRYRVGVDAPANKSYEIILPVPIHENHSFAPFIHNLSLGGNVSRYELIETPHGNALKVLGTGKIYITANESFQTVEEDRYRNHSFSPVTFSMCNISLDEPSEYDYPPYPWYYNSTVNATNKHSFPRGVFMPWGHIAPIGTAYIFSNTSGIGIEISLSVSSGIEFPTPPPYPGIFGQVSWEILIPNTSVKWKWYQVVCVETVS